MGLTKLVKKWSREERKIQRISVVSLTNNYNSYKKFAFKILYLKIKSAVLLLV